MNTQFTRNAFLLSSIFCSSLSFAQYKSDNPIDYRPADNMRPSTTTGHNDSMGTTNENGSRGPSSITDGQNIPRESNNLPDINKELEEQDSLTSNNILKDIRKNKEFTAKSRNKVNVKTLDGIVTVTGTVHSKEEAQWVIQQAQAKSPNNKVVDELTVIR